MTTLCHQCEYCDLNTGQCLFIEGCLYCWDQYRGRWVIKVRYEQTLIYYESPL